MVDDSQRTDDASQSDAEPGTAATDETPADQGRDEAPKVAGGGRGLAVLALVLVVALGAGGSWVWLQQVQPLSRAANNQQARFDQMLARADAAGAQSDELRARHKDALSEMRQSRADMANRLDPLERQLATLVTGVAKSDERTQALTERVEALAGELTVATAYLGRNRGDWLVEEAEHLLTVAMQQAQLAGQPASAAAALDLADQSLRMTDDTGWLPVREAIAAARAALSDVDRPDIGGALVELRQVAQDLAQVPIADAPAALDARDGGGAADATAVPAGAGDRSGWRTAMREAADQLGAIFVVQRSDTPVQPLRTPQERAFLREQLRLRLLAAEVELLSGQADAFKASLERSRDWLQRYYPADAPAVQAARERLQALEARSFEQALPDLSAPLQRLREIRRRRAAEAP